MGAGSNAAFGLPAPPSFTKVNETGGTAFPAANSGWITEIALDVEWAHAVAPGAGILLVEANSVYNSDVFTAVNYARNAAGVVAVSMSWSGGEFSGETADDSSYFTTPAAFRPATAIASTPPQAVIVPAPVETAASSATDEIEVGLALGPHSDHNTRCALSQCDPVEWRGHDTRCAWVVD